MDQEKKTEKPSSEKLKQVSCYLNENLKFAIEKEAGGFKYEGNEARNSINRDMSYIIETFIDKYTDRIEEVADIVVKVSSVDSFDSVNQKELLKTLDYSLKAYPLKLSENFNKKLDKFRIKCNEVFGFKFSKTGLYNLILLDYFIENKVDLAKKDLEFWMQDYFARSGSSGNFEEVIDMFKALVDKMEGVQR